MNPTQSWNCGRCGALFKDEAEAHACCKCVKCALPFSRDEAHGIGEHRYQIRGDKAECEVCRAAKALREAEDYHKEALARRERAKP